MYNTHTRGFVSDLLGEDFIFAVDVLGASLAKSILDFARRQHLFSREDLWFCIWAPKNPWASAWMLENGWCPYEVDRFSRVFSPLTQIAALGLQPSAHRLDHSACTPYACGANNMTDENSPMHAEDCTRTLSS